MILTQPYPCREVNWKSIWGCLLSGIFVFVFLIVFQPFGISYWHEADKLWKIAGYGVVTFVVLSFNFFAIKKNLTTVFDEDKWQVWKEIVWNLVILFNITLGNFLYNQLIFTGNQGIKTDFLLMFFVTLAVGIFPVSVFTFVNYTLLLRKYSQPIAIKETIAELPTIPDKLWLTAENGKDKLGFAASDLLFIESSDNYATVYFLDEEKIKKELIRSSLSRLETQIKDSFIARCHRSYIVNLGKVSAVSGNAQGYKLYFPGTEQRIPVARKYASEIIGHLKKSV
jgi:hypothetical protein